MQDIDIDVCMCAVALVKNFVTLLFQKLDVPDNLVAVPFLLLPEQQVVHPVLRAAIVVLVVSVRRRLHIILPPATAEPIAESAEHRFPSPIPIEQPVINGTYGVDDYAAGVDLEIVFDGGTF